MHAVDVAESSWSTHLAAYLMAYWRTGNLGSNASNSADPSTAGHRCERVFSSACYESDVREALRGVSIVAVGNPFAQILRQLVRMLLQLVRVTGEIACELLVPDHGQIDADVDQ